MSIVVESILPCVAAPEIFLDASLQISTPSELSAENRRREAKVRTQAQRLCAGCPQFVDCLFKAVVEVDVTGYVACTTEPERAVLRRRLGVEINQSGLTSFGAPRVGGGPVSHEAVLAARQSHPKDTVLQLAERLGCSTSTIKRHLRRERRRVHGSEVEVAPAPTTRPDVDQVLDAFDELEAERRQDDLRAGRRRVRTVTRAA